MPNLGDIITQLQRELTCPVCGKNFEIGEIRLKGLFDRTLIIQTICSASHMTLFMTTIQHDLKKEAPISTNDILDFHQEIKSFKGDFQTLWKN